MIRTTLAALLGCLLLGASGAALAEDAKIKSMSYSTYPVTGFGTINVYSSDGQQWDTLAGPPVKFTAAMEVDTKWPGYVEKWGIFNGLCMNLQCSQNPLIWAEGNNTRDLSENGQFEIGMDEIPVSNDGIATIPLGDEILAACNEHLSVAGAASLHVFNRNLWTSFSVDTDKMVGDPTNNPVEIPTPGVDHVGFNGGDATKQAPMIVEVRCNPYNPDFDADVPNQDFAVEEVEMFLSTFSDAVTHPDADTTCRKGRVLVRVTTNQAGPVAMRLYTIAPGYNEEYIETWSSHVGSGVYEAEVIRWLSVDETTYVQALAEVENGVFDLQAGWDGLTLECTEDTPDYVAPGRAPGDGPGRNPGNKVAFP